MNASSRTAARTTAPTAATNGPFSLPALPWAKNALEPVISARTVDLHHGKHHGTYVEKLNKLEPLLKRNGAIWIVYPKGLKLITEASVMAASKAANFVDNKTCRFSDTHTGLRVVIPIARR